MADAALAADEPLLARTSAQEAARLFRRQGRDRGEMLARIKIAQARYASGERSRGLLRDATAAAAAADRHRVAEAIEAHVLAANAALALGDQAAAEPHLVRAARARTGRSAAGRVLGWYAAARRADVAGRRKGVFDACERGLRVLDAHQASLGAVEMRAAATAHGSALADMAARAALSSDDSRALLRWTERWRATTFAIPAVRPPEDAGLAADLATLRHTTRLIVQATASGRPAGGLERERRRVEEEVRRQILRTSATTADASTWRDDIDVDELLAGLGDTRLVEILRLDGRLHVLVATPAGVRRHAGGTWDEAVREAEFTRFALLRLAYQSGHDERPASEQKIAAAAGALEASAARLQRLLLADTVSDLGEGPLVISPPAALHPVPWGALPALTDRVVSVVPSAMTWLRGRQAAQPAHRRVSVVVGPGLECGALEAGALAAHYPGAEVLTAGAATTDRVLASLEGRWLAHIAAHGTFRADNPLFSSLLLDDGPLIVHDLQRLQRAPYRLVLTCCDGGVTGSAGSDELLGLVAALGQIGTAAVIAPVVAVSDAATVPVALAVHEQLAGGATTSEALRAARTSTHADPRARAAARAFVAFGAA